MQWILILVLVGSVSAGIPDTRQVVSNVNDQTNQVHDEVLLSKTTTHRKKTAPLDCEMCELIIQFIKAEVEKGGATIDVIEKFVKALCKRMQKDECSAIERNLLAIIQWIKEGMDPSDICVKLNLCTSQSLKSENKRKQKLQNSIECTACKTLTKLIWYEVEKTNKTIEIIEKEIKELCHLLVSEVCIAVINELDKIIQMIEDHMKPEQICEKLGFCPPQPSMKKKDTESNDICSTCKYIMNVIHYEIVYANATVEMVEELIRDLCNVTHIPFCNTILNDIDKIIQWIEDGVDPEKICQYLHLCPQQRIRHLTDVRKLKQIDNCTVCEATVSLVEMMVLDFNASKDAIQEALEFTCALFDVTSKEFGDECRNISSKLDSVITDIKDKKSVQDICKSFGYCKSNIKVELNLCENCKIIVNFIEAQIKLSNASIEIIEKLVLLFCKMLDKPAQEMCHTLVSKIDDIKEWIEQGLDPKDICEELGICPKLSRDQLNKKDPYVVLV